MHSIFIQVPKGDVTVIDEIPSLREAEMFNGFIYLFYALEEQRRKTFFTGITYST